MNVGDGAGAGAGAGAGGAGAGEVVDEELVGFGGEGGGGFGGGGGGFGEAFFASPPRTPSPAVVRGLVVPAASAWACFLRALAQRRQDRHEGPSDGPQVPGTAACRSAARSYLIWTGTAV